MRRLGPKMRICGAPENAPRLLGNRTCRDQVRRIIQERRFESCSKFDMDATVALMLDKRSQAVVCSHTETRNYSATRRAIIAHSLKHNLIDRSDNTLRGWRTESSSRQEECHREFQQWKSGIGVFSRNRKGDQMQIRFPSLFTLCRNSFFPLSTRLSSSWNNIAQTGRRLRPTVYFTVRLWLVTYSRQDQSSREFRFGLLWK